jgi:hypothetical protein
MEATSRGTIAVEPAQAERFYSGPDQGWGAIRQSLDVQRRVSYRLLEFMAESTALAIDGPGRGADWAERMDGRWRRDPEETR